MVTQEDDKYLTRSPLAYGGNSFEQFLGWTNEKVLLGKAIREFVLPNYESILDVGAGDGTVCKYYLDLFTSPVLIEPSSKFAQTLTQLFPQATVINKKIEDYKTDPNSFDMVLASNIFQYVNDQERTVRKLIAATKPGGRFVVTMLDPESPFLKFIDKFWAVVHPENETPKKFRFPDLLKLLNEEKQDYYLTEIVTTIRPPSIQSFLDINDFIFSTPKTAISCEALKQMEQYLQQISFSNTFEIDTIHKLLVIGKP